MFDYNDLSLGIVQAAQAVTSYYMIGYYSTNTATDGRFRRVKVSRRDGVDAELTLPRGLFRRQGVREVHRRRQGAPARRRADARESDHRHHDRDGGELLPVESRRVLRAGGGEDAGQRADPRTTSGASRVTIDLIGEMKDEYGVTHQNVRDRIEIRFDQPRRPVPRPAFTLLPGSYVIKVLARTTLRADRHVPGGVHGPNLDREAVRLAISTVVLTSQRVALATRSTP